jgi:hypothetical protein
MELHGSDLGSLGFSRTDIYESVLMCFKDAICLRKILLNMALDTVHTVAADSISRYSFFRRIDFWNVFYKLCLGKVTCLAESIWFLVTNGFFWLAVIILLADTKAEDESFRGESYMSNYSCKIVKFFFTCMMSAIFSRQLFI